MLLLAVLCLNFSFADFGPMDTLSPQRTDTYLLNMQRKRNYQLFQCFAIYSACHKITSGCRCTKGKVLSANEANIPTYQVGAILGKSEKLQFNDNDDDPTEEMLAVNGHFVFGFSTCLAFALNSSVCYQHNMRTMSLSCAGI